MQGVLWTKGVMLNPQHLQTQDRHLEDTLHFRMSALSDYPYGFSELTIDEEALSTGEFSISNGSGLFPDGLCFDFPAADEPPPPKPLEPHLRPDQDTMVFHLAIPRRRWEGRNVSESSADAGARFSPAVVKRRDENTGASERDILVARRNLRLLAEGESLEGATTLPVARLVREPSGEVRLDSTFVPPLLDISASPELVTIARRLLETLSARSTGLSATRRERSLGTAHFGVSDVANFWLLYTVNSFLPLVRHHYQPRERSRLGGDGLPREGRSHPADLFGTMSELAAALMTFSTTYHPRDLPPYDHKAPADAFSKLDDTLRGLLDTVVPTNAITLTLEMSERSIYGVSLDQGRVKRATQAYLAVGSDMPQDELIDGAPDWIKVASQDGIREIVSKATSGIPMRHVPVAPSVLPVKLGHQYFRLEVQHPEWRRVLQTRQLAAWVSTKVPDPQVELVLILPPDES